MNNIEKDIDIVDDIEINLMIIRKVRRVRRVRNVRRVKK